MLTKADFQQAIRDTIAAYPALAPLYQAGDPRLLQHLEAIATMLAMLSGQIEVAMMEPFDKARPATILADAALKGVLRKGVPARFRIHALNRNATPFEVGGGVSLLDSNGRPCRVETPVTIAGHGGTATFEAVQVKTRTYTHTVSGSVPFYQVEVPPSEDDMYLSGLSVSDAHGEFTYAPKFTNIAPGDRVFHVETDEFQRMFIRFGYANVVGHQPADGEVLTVTIAECAGDVRPDTGSPFAFEYLYTPQHSQVELTMEALVTPGQNPPDLTTLRDLCRYPSVYDDSAVYLGEFDFVIRRTLTDLQFLSVWNETIEERVRGPNVDHINTLFVACVSAAGSETVLDEPDPNAPVSPTVIPNGSLTGTQQHIRHLIGIADDSYRVKFLTPVRSKITLTVSATIAIAYDADAVEAQIIAILLDEYGIDTKAAQHGSLRPLYQRVYEVLRAKVPALQDKNSDFQVAIAPPPDPVRPEHWRYLAADSLTVTITLANTVTSSWGEVLG